MSIPFDSALSSTAEEPQTIDAERKLDTDGAFELSDSFCDRVAPQAKRYAMSIVRVWADAEEIVQEAFCRLLKSDRCNTQPTLENNNRDNSSDEDQAEVFQTESGQRGKAFLFSIIRNLSIDHLRTNGRRRFEAVDVRDIANVAQENDELSLQRLENGIQEVLDELPPQWSDAIQLKVNGKLTYDEIASVLQATRAQVRTWIYRARKQLEKDLNQKGLLEFEH